MDEKTLQKLKPIAEAARNFAHAPYSNAHLGCALQTTTGKIFSGANMENASLGATVCAERVAVWTSQTNETSKIESIVICTDTKDVWPPCGMCRQVLAEFGQPTTAITSINRDGQQKSWTLEQLLPDSFTPKFLTK